MDTQLVLSFSAAAVTFFLAPVATDLLKDVAGGRLRKLSPIVCCAVSVAMHLLAWWLWSDQTKQELFVYVSTGFGVGIGGVTRRGWQERREEDSMAGSDDGLTLPPFDGKC